MSGLRRQRPDRPSALDATVSRTDPLTVLVDSFDGGAMIRHEWEVAGWQPRPDATPAVGDDCLVVLSDAGRAWVVVGNWTGARP